MSNTTKGAITQVKVQELKAFTENALRCTGRGGSFLRFLLAGCFDDIAHAVSTLENRAQGLEANLKAARQENTRLTQELEQRRTAEDIPFGAVEADPEVARLERENAELQLTLEARVDELEVCKLALARVTRPGTTIAFTHTFQGVTGLSTLTREE